VTLRYSSKAREDLSELTRYLRKEFGVVVARRVTETLRARCRLAARAPGIGRRRDDIFPGLREAVVGVNVILYCSSEEHVVIERIIDGRRNIKALFE